MREAVELPRCKMPDFIPLLRWPPNSPDLNPVNYGAFSSSRSTRTVHTVEELRERRPILEELELLDQCVTVRSNNGTSLSVPV